MFSRLSFLILVVGFSAPTIVYAERITKMPEPLKPLNIDIPRPSVDSHGPIVSRALRLVEQNNRTAAFKLLDNLARDSNSPEQTDAAYHAGLLILNNTNIKNRESVAIPYLQLASDRKHYRASMLLTQLSNIKTARKSGVVDPSFLKPTNTQLTSYQAAVDAYEKRKHSTYKVTAHYFHTSPFANITRLLDMEIRLKKVDPTALRLHYHIVADEESILSSTVPPRSLPRLPPNGYEPDFNGASAKRMRIQRYPAYVIEARNEVTVFYDQATFFTELNHLLTAR